MYKVTVKLQKHFCWRMVYCAKAYSQFQQKPLKVHQLNNVILVALSSFTSAEYIKQSSKPNVQLRKAQKQLHMINRMNIRSLEHSNIRTNPFVSWLN